jgi:hypothetical protein
MAVLQDLRQHFVANEVANVELGNKIMAHIAGPREYGARVEDLRLYDAVSSDVIRRWTYPMVPDNGTTGKGCVLSICKHTLLYTVSIIHNGLCVFVRRRNKLKAYHVIVARS